MSPTFGYPLRDVLTVASIHPFYSDVKYPPDQKAVEAAIKQAALITKPPDLTLQPLMWKRDLYEVIERLVRDTSPQNTYRHNVYTSVTGGGSSSQFMFFATDALENRLHRAWFGQFLRNTDVIKHGDWVLTTHWAGDLYRSLDLTLEIMENAGASVLAAGCVMPPPKVIGLLRDFHVNVLTGDASQIVSVVHCISTLSPAEREKIKLDKIIYTSEVLTVAQKKHIYAVLGPVKIFSILGSSEAGPYGISNPDLTMADPAADYADFVIDTRMTLFEILPLSCAESTSTPEPLPEGKTGTIAQTSLSRLRNPLVRYMTGDIGSLHPLPSKARGLIDEAHWPYMRVLRLKGRDQRFSFLWDGSYIDFGVVSEVMAEHNLGVLQWQIILDRIEPSQEASLEVRLLYCRRDEEVLSKSDVVDRFREFFVVSGANEHRFQVTFVDTLTGFELSKTGRKVSKLIDRFS
ncbi:hypothetical protein F66182_4464 [Fusarium sp. NRRL 66182]|nr:hypothetical protein F66182_4464 [Fusarium sp. NRRL 66182]